MKKLRFLISLTNDDNDYQIEQAAAAKEAAKRLDVDLEVISAGNDAITQSTQLLKVIQASGSSVPNAIIFEPVGGTALPQVARAAAGAGIGWAVMNREAEYIPELRRTSKAPIFSLSSDHKEIGRIQGRQFAALLPGGGMVLYIQGPSENSAAKERTAGMQATKPGNIQIMMLKGQWTEESAYRVVSSWLRLMTSQKAKIDLVGAQDDSMAMGARKAFHEVADEAERQRWLSLPFLGCDGLPKTGQAWVRQGLLAGTIYVPPNADQAVAMMAQAIKTGVHPPERALTIPTSFPPLESLAATPAEKNKAVPT